MLPDLFKRLKPLYGDHIDRLWIAYQLGNQDEKRDIEVALTILAIRKQGIALGNERIILEPPDTSLSARGELLLGNIEYPGMRPYPVMLSYQELLRHVFLLGPSGTGKSTFIIGLLRQFLRDHVPFWCVDFKRNYRCLLHDAHGQDVLVLSVGRNLAPARCNMLIPPRGVERNEWIEAVGEVISNSYLLMHGARNVLKSALSGSKTLREAHDHLSSELTKARSGSRRYGWLESAHRAIEELSKGALGEALNAINPTPLENMLNIPVVFELQGLGDDQKRCICLYLLQSVLLLRKHQHDQREVLKHVLVFDEAHNVFPKEQWGELSVPSRLAREVREYGEAIISATQQADVADSLIANSGTKIILRTDYPKDVDFSSKLLQLEHRWITKIPMGQAVIRLPTRYYQSFLITFPEQPLKNNDVPDSVVLERYTQSGINTTTATTQPEQLPTPKHEAALAEKEHALLEDISAHPISTVTERYNRLSWNPKTGNTIKDRLLAADLIAFEVLQVPNSRVKLLTLTDKGHEYAIAHNITITGTGRASLEHEFWRARLRERCEKRGYKVTTEHHLGNGKRVDLLAVKGDRRFLIEIETGKSDIQANITKTEALGRLIIFCTAKKIADTLQAPEQVTVLHPENLADLHALLGFPPNGR